MTLNEYQDQAMTTCMDSCANIPYMLFNLQGEVGELSSKIAKAIRKEQLEFIPVLSKHNVAKFQGPESTNPLGANKFVAEIRQALKGELGDVLWQISGLCRVLSFDLEDVAKFNLDKLASRQQRGLIDGEGDNR